MSIYTTGLIYLGPARVIKDLIRSAKKVVNGGYSPYSIQRQYNVFRNAFRLAYIKGLEDYYDKTTLKQRYRDLVSDKDHTVSKKQLTSTMLNCEYVRDVIRHSANNVCSLLYENMDRFLSRFTIGYYKDRDLTSALDKSQKRFIIFVRKELERMYYLGQGSGRQSLRLSPRKEPHGVIEF